MLLRRFTLVSYTSLWLLICGKIFTLASTNPTFLDCTSFVINFSFCVNVLWIYHLTTLRRRPIGRNCLAFNLLGLQLKIYWLRGKVIELLTFSWDSMRAMIMSAVKLMKKTLPTLSEVYNIPDNDDSQRSARISPSSGVELSAFQVSGNSGTSQYQKGRPVCTYCLWTDAIRNMDFLLVSSPSI